MVDVLIRESLRAVPSRHIDRSAKLANAIALVAVARHPDVRGPLLDGDRLHSAVANGIVGQRIPASGASASVS
ncbi:MAG: hypothetical protein ABI867_41730 [Kofleriaceae bacterium]